MNTSRKNRSSKSRCRLNIIGISSHFHDSACCLLQDGRLVAAAQEERFSRIKHDKSIPKAALAYCLSEGDITISDVDCVAYFENPAIKLERQLWTTAPNLRPFPRKALFRLDASAPMRDIRGVLGEPPDCCTPAASSAKDPRQPAASAHPACNISSETIHGTSRPVAGVGRGDRKRDPSRVGSCGGAVSRRCPNRSGEPPSKRVRRQNLGLGAFGDAGGVCGRGLGGG
jgi:hypothetical protein